MTSETHHVTYLRLRSQRSQAWLVDPGLRPRLVADALAQDTNLTEVAVGILAGRYGVAYIPQRRKTFPRVNDEVINMRLPGKLWTAIQRAAIRSRREPMDEVRFALSDHYGFAFPP